MCAQCSEQSLAAVSAFVAVAALFSVRVPSPAQRRLRRHDGAFELHASHNCLFCLEKMGVGPGLVPR